MRLKDFAAHSTPKFNIAKLIPIETLPALSIRAASPILLHTSLVLSPEPADTPHKNRLAHQTQLWFGIQVLFSRCCRAQSLHAVIKHTLAGPATNQFIMASYFCDHITEHRIIRAHSKGRKGRYSLLLTLSLPNPTRVCTRVTETVKWKQLLHSFTKIRRNWTSFQPFRKLLNSWLSCWDRMSSIWGQKANRKKSPVEILAIFVPFAPFFFFFYMFSMKYICFYGVFVAVCYCECVLSCSLSPFFLPTATIHINIPIRVLQPMAHSSGFDFSEKMFPSHGCTFWPLPNSTLLTLGNNEWQPTFCKTCVKSSYPWNTGTN